MEYIKLKSGDTAARFACAILDERIPANMPVTGASMTLTIQRCSDGKYWDWVASEWDIVADWASLTADHKTAMTDEDTGWYSKTWNQATADSSAEADYVAIFCIASGNYQGMAYALTQFRLDETRLKETHAAGAFGQVVDEGDGTRKVYDGPDPTADNLLWTVTETVAGDEYTYTRTDS